MRYALCGHCSRHLVDKIYKSGYIDDNTGWSSDENAYENSARLQNSYYLELFETLLHLEQLFNFKYANSPNLTSEVYVAGGTYESFAGRDASRSLATMTMTVSDTYDTLQDLSENEREKLEHWEKQFTGTHAARRTVVSIWDCQILS